jgi:hypothetical protein
MELSADSIGYLNWKVMEGKLLWGRYRVWVDAYFLQDVWVGVRFGV